MRLLSYRPFDFFDVYTCDGLSEYFYGSMVESTAKRRHPLPCGFIIRAWCCSCRGKTLQGAPAPFVERPKLMRTYVRSECLLDAFCDAKRQQT